MLLQIAAIFTAMVGIVHMQNSSVFIAEAPDLSPVISNLSGQFGDVSELSASSAFLIDTIEGTILFDRAADETHPLASITKLMTAVTVLESLDDGFAAERISFNSFIKFITADRRNGGIPYLIPGEEITLYDAWNIMLVGSSNDAAQLLARVISGSEQVFVDKMNEKARALGLRHTFFADPTGLDENNVSTAREAAILLRFALAHKEIRDALRIWEFQFTPRGKTARRVRSTNWLTGASFTPGTRSLGGKTGHIEASGYNFAFASGSGKHELIGVVLGAESNDARFREMRKLMEWGFNIIQE